MTVAVSAARTAGPSGAAVLMPGPLDAVKSGETLPRTGQRDLSAPRHRGSAFRAPRGFRAWAAGAGLETTASCGVALLVGSTPSWAGLDAVTGAIWGWADMVVDPVRGGSVDFETEPVGVLPVTTPPVPPLMFSGGT